MRVRRRGGRRVECGDISAPGLCFAESLDITASQPEGDWQADDVDDHRGVDDDPAGYVELGESR
jgi:hypothetical protein